MGDWKTLVTTNREVINAMTDEQLAIWALRDAPAINRRRAHSGGLAGWLGEAATRLEYRRIEE